MLKAKDGKLVRLCKDDQEFVWEAYLEGGVNIVYRISYYDIKKAHALLITDSNGNEVCALLSKDVTRMVALTDEELIMDGLPLDKFIREYCPDFVESLDEVEAQKKP